MNDNMENGTLKKNIVAKAKRLAIVYADSIKRKASRAEGKGDAQAAAPNPPNPTPKEEMMAQMIAQRQGHLGREPTNKEKQAMSKYIDDKVKSYGPDATLSDLNDNEKKSMVSFASAAREEKLYQLTGMEQNGGPVREAVQVIPDLTTYNPPYPLEPIIPPKPDYTDEYNKKEAEKKKLIEEYEKKYGKYDPDKEPKLDSWYFTDSGRKEDEDKINAWTAIWKANLEAEGIKKKEKFQQEKWEEDKAAAEAQYEKDKKWADGGAQQALQAALSTGALKIEDDPTDKNDNRVKVQVLVEEEDGKKHWETHYYDNPDAARDALIADTEADSLVGKVPDTFKHELSDDLKTAIATRDVTIEPSADGRSLNILRMPDAGGDGLWHEVPQGGAWGENGALTQLESDLGPAKDEKTGEDIPGTSYQDKHNLDWNDMDGAITDVDRAQAAVAAAAAADEQRAHGNTDAMAKCPVCGKDWPAATPTSPTETTPITIPETGDITQSGDLPGGDIPSADQPANTEESLVNPVTGEDITLPEIPSVPQVPSIPSIPSIPSTAEVVGTVTGALGLAPRSNAVIPLNKRSVALREKAIRYVSRFGQWVDMDAAIRLTIESLKANPRNFTPNEIKTLCEDIDKTALITSNNIDAFAEAIRRGVSSDDSPAIVSNIKKIVSGLKRRHNIVAKRHLHMRKLGAGGTCPMCGQKIDADDKLTMSEMEVAKGSEKGKVLADQWEGTAGTEYKVLEGLAELFRDGSQQGLNPFTFEDAKWTKFSFRPTDSMEQYPIISIIPASFQSISSINPMLNNVPYVIVSEYFMRNNIGSVISMFQALTNWMGGAEQAAEGQVQQKSTAKEMAQNLVTKIAKLIGEVDAGVMEVDMPFVLYHRLKGKSYGNRYILPYIPKENSITESDNSGEWGDNQGLTGTILNGVMEAVNGTVGGLMGFGIAKPFPAPTWALPSSGYKWSMNFTLNLMNDEFIRARSNYMCVNTIINNNRWIQKTVLAFPGALYEVMLPTGVRELMCTGGFQLKSLGVPRRAPTGFFEQPFHIGSKVVKQPQGKAMHDGSFEVIPDAYSLTCTFKSAIDENLNNSIFAYYLNIVEFAPGTSVDGAAESLIQWFKSPEPKVTGFTAMVAPTESKNAGELVGEAADSLLEKFANAWEGAEELAASKDNPTSETPEPGTNPVAPGGTTPTTPTTPTEPGANTTEQITTNTGEDVTIPAAATARRGLIKRDDIPDFVKDGKEAIYKAKYATLTSQLNKLNKALKDKTGKLMSLYSKENDMEPCELRKTYHKRVKNLKAQIQTLTENIDNVQEEIVELEMQILVHAKEKAIERTTSKVLAVPRSYFEPPELDEVTKLKLALMTREEKEARAAEIRAQIKKFDKWGVFDAPDYKLRVCVIAFIKDAVQELEELMRDVEETDPGQYDEYRYRRNMLIEDFNAVLDTKTPFILNKTNLIYIPQEYIPEDWKRTDDYAPNTTEEVVEDVQLISSEENVSDMQIVYSDGEAETPVDKEELMRQHTREVIKQKFGDEDGLAKKAYEKAVAENTTAQLVRKMLIELKGNPDIEDALTHFVEQTPDPEDDEETVERKAYYNAACELLNLRTRDESGAVINIYEDSVKPQTLNRALAIMLLTRLLYRIIEASRTVLLNNALNEVDTVAKLALDKASKEIHRKHG